MITDRSSQHFYDLPGEQHVFVPMAVDILRLVRKVNLLEADMIALKDEVFTGGMSTIIHRCSLEFKDLLAKSEERA